MGQYSAYQVDSGWIIEYRVRQCLQIEVKQNLSADFLLVEDLTPAANLDRIGRSSIDYVMNIYLPQKSGNNFKQVLILTCPA